MIDERARQWAVWLTQQPSVTGSVGERMLPEAVVSRIAADPSWNDARAWTFEIPGDRLRRRCVAVLARGTGSETLLLTGHFDTVAVDDYGDLAELATDPERLLPALRARLANPSSAAEALAASDFAGGRFLPGRGLLDMKAGLAAGLAAMEAFLRDPERQGNLLFVGVPDEEVTSTGARALAARIPALEREHGLKLVGAINLDCIGDTGDGTAGRAVALGSVGKLLATAYVAGVATHASHPHQGVNAAALAGALAARLEWATELADADGDEPGIAPTLLSLKDSKRHYDVTTPEAAFATWNILSLTRPAAEVMARIERLAREAVDGFRRDMQARLPAGHAAPAIDIVPAETLFATVRESHGATLDALATRLAEDGLSLPDQNERLTAEAWRLSGRRGPAIVLGFGSLPYPAVIVGPGADGERLLTAIDAARAEAPVPIALTRYFPGISDMSFLGEADVDGMAFVAANTPAWRSGVRWGGEIGNIPTVNIGPWGRDYHTLIERVETDYAFRVLPQLLLDIARRRFG
jgi:arginine utilization protein RocB